MVAESQRTAEEMWECLEALDAANVAARLRYRTETGLGPNDLAALEFLSNAHARGRQVSPVDVTRSLAISSASTTAILDRLEKRGHITRVPHPTDRRRVFVEPSDEAARNILSARQAARERLARPLASVDDAQAAIIIAFLDRVREAVEASEPELAPSATT